MAKPEWGTKRICQSCSAPFYDLRRDPIKCPKCGAKFDPESVLKSRRPRSAEEPAAEKAKAKEEKPAAEEAVPKTGDEDAAVGDDADELLKEVAIEVDDKDADDDDDDDVLEDASDLGGEDVIDVVDTGKDKEDT